jgi:DNA topoisomerase-3
MASVSEKAVQPPKSYTYHGLIGAMNNIHKFVKDPDIRSKLKEVQGIGTEATREAVLSTLFKRGYLEKTKKQISSTPLGRLLIGILSEGTASVMVYPDMTAIWEGTMTEIENGSAALESFISEVAGLARDSISDRLAIPQVISDVHGITKQPGCLTDGCGGFLRRIAMPGKPAFFSCPLCHATFSDVNGVPVPKKKHTGDMVEAPCPRGCGRNARRFEGKYGAFWKCDCSPDVTFRDIDGVPAVKEPRDEALCKPCPANGCKGKAVRFGRKSDGRPFWKCSVCGGFFEDIDGAPILRKKKEQRRGK